MRGKSMVIGAALLAAAASAAPLRAHWYENGTAVCTAAGQQRYPWIVEDGEGGAFMAWEDGRSLLLMEIYAQRIDANGWVLWAYDGIPVSTGGSGDKQRPMLVQDGSGGCIIVWYDMRGGVDFDIYAQRLSGSGSVLWTANGVALCTAPGDQSRADLVSDGAGGAIIAWYDERDGTGSIYAQRIDPNGTALWNAGGVALCDAAGYQDWGKIVADGAGGAVIAWHDSRGGDYDIYAQRLDADGNPLWEPGGVRLCGAAGDQSCRAVVSDGAGGAIAIWEDARYGSDIYARRIGAGGTPLWADDGVALCTAPGHQDWPRACSDGNGGAIVAWCDEGSPFDTMQDLFMQKINADGVVTWAADGIVLVNCWGDQQNVHLIPDGFGGANIAWRDGRVMSDVYAQRVGADGCRCFQAGGAPVGRAENTQTLGHLAGDGRGGAIVVWYDYRSLEYDIYAYRINFSTADFPPVVRSVRDVPLDQGGWLSIQWNRSEIDETSFRCMAIDHYSVWRRLPLALTPLSGGAGPDSLLASQLEDAVRCFIGAEVPPGHEEVAYRIDTADPDFAWEWLGSVPAMGFETYALTAHSLYDSTAYSTGWQYFMVTAHTAVPEAFYESAVDSGYSVDNLPPLPPKGFAARQVPPLGYLLLSWEPNGESDIHHYRIYRSDEEEFVPGPENLLAETGGTSFHDEEWTEGSLWCYRLSACDVHGNEGESVLVTPMQIIATLLQSFSVEVGSGVVVSWRLAEIDEGISFRVLRSADGGAWIESAGGTIIRDGLAFEYVDIAVEPGTTYRYRVEITGPSGSWILFETDDVSTPQIPLTLYRNHPNPFNAATSITFHLPASGRVLLEVFDVAGRRVAVLADVVMPMGAHTVSWDGTGDSGETLSSGVYFCTIGFEKKTVTRKMILLR